MIGFAVLRFTLLHGGRHLAPSGRCRSAQGAGGDDGPQSRGSRAERRYRHGTARERHGPPGVHGILVQKVTISKILKCVDKTSFLCANWLILLSILLFVDFAGTARLVR